MKRIFLGIFCSFLLIGCWSSHELDNTVFINTVGFDKSDNQLRIAFEIIKPGAIDESNGSNDSQESGKHIVLGEDSETLLEGAYEIIKYTKRRPDFGHTKTWIISEKLARENLVDPLDFIRRNQMLRLNSHVFITKDDPIDILNTPTLYENIAASELSSALNQTKYISEYAPITIREFFKLLESPIPNAYIPIIHLDKVNNQEITSIDGTAIIKDDRMVGALNKKETVGLNLLLNHVKGGSIQVNLNNKDRVSLEILNSKTKTTPKLNGNKLNVTIQTQLEGLLADNMTSHKVDEHFLKEIEVHLSKHIKETIHSTLNKLQNELNVDVTKIGLETYRKYTKHWQEIVSKWDEIFANANISIEVDTNVIHKGLINDRIRHHTPSQRNPYLFWK